GVRLDGQRVAGLPARAAGQRIAVLGHFLDFGVETPGGVVRLAITVQIAGVAAGIVRCVPTEGAEVRKTVLFALRAGGERDGKVVVDVLDHAAAGPVTEAVVMRQVLAFFVVRRTGTEAEFRSAVLEGRERTYVDCGCDTTGDERGVLCLVDLGP